MIGNHNKARAASRRGAPLRATPTQEVAMPYRVVEYDSGPEGMEGMEALINEWAAKGYRLDQIVRRTTYDWLLIFSSLS